MIEMRSFEKGYMEGWEDSKQENMNRFIYIMQKPKSMNKLYAVMPETAMYYKDKGYILNCKRLRGIRYA